MEINIAHLYPDLLNLYGDRGNILTLTKRLELRGIDANLHEYRLNDEVDFKNTDIIFIGGGSDREQRLVCHRLCQYRDEIKSYAKDGRSLIAVCGGYQLLGDYYKLGDEKIEGIGLLDIYTEQGEGRLIGNIILESELIDSTIVGFENHSGRTFIGDHKPLGKVLYGHGNSDGCGFEGVVFNNVIGTYLHGPLLPKNPKLADLILSHTVETKYALTSLPPIDDTIENEAHNYIINRFLER